MTFDPAKISYGEILQIYFSVAHDPTELNRQGPDIGTAVPLDDLPAATRRRRRWRAAYIAQLDKAGVYAAPIATTIEPGRDFYPAEDYHQDYLTLNPTAALHRLQRPAEAREPEAALPRRLARRPGAGVGGGAHQLSGAGSQVVRGSAV